jgi:mono/diheme cytochrome c family protein
MGTARNGQDLLDGQRFYNERGCANCHGPNGDLVPGINFSAGQFGGR